MPDRSDLELLVAIRVRLEPQYPYGRRCLVCREPDLRGQVIPTQVVEAELVDTTDRKTVLAGGHCLRAPAQGPCSYANICEHCPNFHPDADHLDVLTRQRDTATTLAADATRGRWATRAELRLAIIT